MVKFKYGTDESEKQPPKHSRYPDMKVPRRKTPQRVARMKSLRTGYVTEVIVPEVERMERLGWELTDEPLSFNPNGSESEINV